MRAAQWEQGVRTYRRGWGARLLMLGTSALSLAMVALGIHDAWFPGFLFLPILVLAINYMVEYVRVGSAGVEHRNLVRRSMTPWSEIVAVEVVPDRFSPGKAVPVLVLAHGRPRRLGVLMSSPVIADSTQRAFVADVTSQLLCRGYGREQPEP